MLRISPSHFRSGAMRGFVLLCLLCPAVAKYSWNQPGQTTPEPKPGHACVAERRSCHCCLMLQEVNRLRTHFNRSLNELEETYLQTEQSLSLVKANYVAMSVALYSEEGLECFGPFGAHKVVTYKHVFINQGDGYNGSTGVFTVPGSGVYSLALTVYSDAGASSSTLAACAGLQVNGLKVTGQSEKNKQDQEDSTTTVVALHLQAGDQVSVSLDQGCFLCDDHNHYNTFSAFLLYAD